MALIMPAKTIAMASGGLLNQHISVIKSVISHLAVSVVTA